MSQPPRVEVPDCQLQLHEMGVCFAREAAVRKTWDREVDRIVGKIKKPRLKVEPRIVAGVAKGVRHPGFKGLSDLSPNELDAAMSALQVGPKIPVTIIYDPNSTSLA